MPGGRTSLAARLARLVLLASLLAACGTDAPDPAEDAPVSQSPRVLVFSKTTGYRHDSIPDAIAALERLAAERGWDLAATEDAAVFTDQDLGAFDVVVFLLTSGEVLDEAQQAAFERFIRSGKGWVGVHSASDTEYDWPFYGELVGAYFQAHPAVQQARVRVERGSHLATEALPETWTRTDEWYGFVENPRASVTVLLSLDESSYAPGDGAMGDHPIAWYHGYEGGRAFYTALGHTRESYTEPELLAHVAGGIEWAAGRESERTLLVEFDGVAQNGIWEAHQPQGFEFEVGPDALLMRDQGGDNQHLVRRGLALDPTRPYAVETLFTVLGAPDAPAPNSFCLNLNVAGPDGDLEPPSTWAINVDLTGASEGGLIRHMGFVDGGFGEIGETPVAWGVRGKEYLLRATVRGTKVSVQVFEEGRALEAFDVDYASFPYQPTPGQPVRVGANTHGTDWSLRSFRVYTPPG